MKGLGPRRVHQPHTHTHLFSLLPLPSSPSSGTTARQLVGLCLSHHLPGTLLLDDRVLTAQNTVLASDRFNLHIKPRKGDGICDTDQRTKKPPESTGRVFVTGFQTAGYLRCRCPSFRPGDLTRLGPQAKSLTPAPCSFCNCRQTN